MNDKQFDLILYRLDKIIDTLNIITIAIGVNTGLLIYILLYLVTH